MSVVICAYTEDRWLDIVAAVESVARQTVAPVDIVLVVDHNTNLLQRVRAEIAGVVAIENRHAQGLSGARNSGIAASRGALVAFLDDDAVAAPDWLERLSAWCRDPRVLGAGGLVEPWWSTPRPGWFPEEFQWVVGCSYRGLPLVPSEVRNPFGGCMCVRRAVFAAVGGFREGIGRVGTRPVGCEETELCIRARQYWPKGVFMYDPRATIRHHVPRGRTRWSYFRARCFAEGLSKAAVAGFVGSADGLASERSYIARTIPYGVARALGQMLANGDWTAGQRAAALVAGVVITAAGYVQGSVTTRLSPPPLLSALFAGRERMRAQGRRQRGRPNGEQTRGDRAHGIVGAGLLGTAQAALAAIAGK